MHYFYESGDTGTGKRARTICGKCRWISGKNESSDKKDDTIVVEGNKNPEANKGDKLPNTGAEISFAIVLAGALALVGAGLALINEKKKIS